jgi:methionine--tRNA ligase beta chain
MNDVRCNAPVGTPSQGSSSQCSSPQGTSQNAPCSSQSAPAIPPHQAQTCQPSAETEQIDIDYFAKVKLRVARIEAVEAIPKSKKLLKLQLDLGPLGKRQILAGIAQFYSPETLIGKKIVVVANLKPAVLMGNESQGMLLAGSSPDGTSLAILSPEIDLPEGSEVR